MIQITTQSKTPWFAALVLLALSVGNLNSHAAESQFSLQVLNEFDAGHPRGLTCGTDGAFYGVTITGGANGHGSVFRAPPNATITTIFSFDGTNGHEPSSPLLQVALQP
jgi:uncharacterized repeat protein (TIGR03803 family)